MKQDHLSSTDSSSVVHCIASETGGLSIGGECFLLSCFVPVLGGCAGDENPGKSTHPRSIWGSHMERRRVFSSHETEHEWMGADVEVKASLRRALSRFLFLPKCLG